MTDTRLARFSDLTTVNIPLYQFGAIAARRVIAGERNSEPRETVLPHRLVRALNGAARNRSGAGEVALADALDQRLPALAPALS